MPRDRHVRWLAGFVTSIFSAVLAIQATDGAAADRLHQEPSAWTYTALGDSIAVGSSSDGGYPQLVRQALQEQVGVPVQLINLACVGCTTTDLRRSIESDRRFRTAVAQAQVVSWNIGGNDLLAARRALASGSCGGSDGQECLRDTVQRFRQNWDAIMAEITSLTSGSAAVALTMDVYDPLVGAERAAPPGGGRGEFGVILAHLDDISSYISMTAAANSVEFAPVRAAFNGPDGREDPGSKGLLIDPIHPSDLGQRLIADLLVDAGTSRVDALREELGNR